MGYWDKADQNKKIAATHTEEMSIKYDEEIRVCVSKTWVYDITLSSPTPLSTLGFKGEILVEATDSVSAIFNVNTTCSGKTAVLNFASYTEPGGRFLDGSSAQEECLCHASFLYNVLKEKPNYYADNAKAKNKALYTNKALYSPRVIFINKKGETTTADVITCASPNLTAAVKYCRIPKRANKCALESRIGFVLDIAYLERVENLVLGAFGCGVFGQDPKEVSEIFKDKLNGGKYHFKKVIFAIPGGVNLEKFKETFNAPANCVK